MTPQELIDLPGYGSAQKKLVELGFWKPHPIDEIRDYIDGALTDIDAARTENENPNCDVRLVSEYLDSAEVSMTQADMAALRLTTEDYK